MSGRGILIALCPIGCLWLAVSCASSSQPPAPPASPAVQTSAGARIPVVPAGYEYSDGSRGVVADSPGPQVLLQGKTPQFVHPGQSFHADFAKTPTAIQITMWRDGQMIFQTSTPGPWNFEQRAGVYYCEVTAWWGKDYAAYDFLVEVGGS